MCCFKPGLLFKNTFAKNILFVLILDSNFEQLCYILDGLRLTTKVRLLIMGILAMTLSWINPWCRQTSAILLVLMVTLFMSGCVGEEGSVPDLMTIGDETVDMNKRETILGGDLFTFGDDDKPDRSSRGSGIGVNAFLWRASLDVLSSWPIFSADPFGGVIITDWYAPPQTPNERFKFNVFILDRVLRADGVRVSIFKQIKNTEGVWQQTALQTETQMLVENSILTRAQKFRTDSLQQ